MHRSSTAIAGLPSAVNLASETAIECVASNLLSDSPPLAPLTFDHRTGQNSRGMNEQPERNGTVSIVRATLSVAVAGVMLVWLLPRFGSYSDALAAVGGLSAADTILLLAMAMLSMVSFWLVTAISLPGLSLGKAGLVKQSSTAVANTIAAGGAVAVGITYAMLSSWRFTSSAITRSVLITGIFNSLVKIGLASALLPFASVRVLGAGDRFTALSAALVFTAAIVVAVVSVLVSDTAAMFAGRLVGVVVDSARRLVGAEPVGRWEERGAQFRTDSRELLSDRWLALTVSSIAAQLSLYVLLLVSVRVVGAGSSAVDATEVLVVFAAVRLVTAVPLTPGAVGVADVGYAAGLTIVAGGAGSDILAAVLVFRAATWLVPTLLGYGALATWLVSYSRSSAEEPVEP
jgi:uncharacterized membrane protein YbhN (UPF0104 family)